MKKPIILSILCILSAFGLCAQSTTPPGVTPWSPAAPAPAIATQITTTPEIYVFPNGVCNYNGQLISHPASKTAGLQEAINLLPVATDYKHPGGGRIVLAPGAYYTSMTITQAWMNRKPWQLSIRGPGMNAGGITYVGPTNADVMTIGWPGGTNETALSIHDFWIASNVNSTNSLLRLNGAQTNNSAAGGFNFVDIEHCWFTWWGRATNQIANLTAGEGVDYPNDQHNLIAINCDNDFSSPATIEHNIFDFVAGVRITADHGSFAHNQFIDCGLSDTHYASGWPSNSIFSAGACVYIIPSSWGTWQGNQPLSIHDNTFIHSACGYYIGLNQNNSAVLMSYNDNFELAAGWNYVITEGRRFVAVNPTSTDGATYANLVTSCTINTNVSNYSYCRSMADTGLVRVVDFRQPLTTTNYAVPGGATLYITNGMVTKVQ